MLTTLGEIKQQELQRDFTESGITIVERKNKQAETMELMFYCSPEIYLAENTADKSCSVLLAEWEDKTQQLLNYTIENPEHCVLVDLGFVLSNPSEFVAFIKQTLDIELSSTQYGRLGNSQLAMQCTQLIDCDSTQECYEDIMAAADLFDEQSEQAVAERLKSYLLATELESGKLKAERDEAKAQLENKTKDLGCENELALLQIHQLQEELESSFVSLNKLTTENTTLTEEKQALELESGKLKVERDEAKALAETTTKDLECENELALLQIHQLQEELEFYYMKLQSVSSVKLNSQANINVDEIKPSLQLLKLLEKPTA